MGVIFSFKKDGKMINIKSILNPTMRVAFEYYRDGNLWYSTMNGFHFPVSVNTTTGTVYKANDKAENFKYWILKEFNKNKEKNGKND